MYDTDDKVLLLSTEIMGQKALKTIIVVSIGLAFLVLVMFSYWSSTPALHRLHENSTGKKTPYL